MSHGVRSRRFKVTATAVAWVMAVSIASQVATASAATANPKPPKPAQVTLPMLGGPGTVVPPPVDATADHTVRAAPAVVWPAAGSVDVALEPASGWVRAGGMPVWMGRSTGKARSGPDLAGAERSLPAAVRVQVLDRATTAHARVAGVLLRVGRIDGQAAPGAAAIEVGYEGFQHAYGGDWAGRLRLSVVPECALTTPDVAACTSSPLPTVNDRGTKRVSAQTDVAPMSATSGGTLVALAAGDSSSEGDFKASDLQASATWSAGGATGNFTWSYPMRVPPALGGPAPQLGLAYSTQSVDGRTAAANSQPSWVGEGFDFWPGFIERSYKACMEDGVANVGDQCWAGDNATMALGAGGGELIRDDITGVWRPKNDDGSIVEKLSGAVNGDEGEGAAPAGEYWKVTTLDGTAYFFGLNRLPGWIGGAGETNSAWTSTVFGNQGGEPCNRSTFAASYCAQAYRWNLDYVVDPHGNTMSFWYRKELNNYARNRTDTTVSTYVRGGSLSEIKYGTRQSASADTTFSANAPMRVVFGVAERCITAGATCTPTNTANWPDVPWDRNCASTTTCAGMYSPTYWTTKKLATITSQVWGGSGYRDVDRWTLSHEFKEPTGGATDILWLKTLTHTGVVGGSLTLPPVTFNPDPNATYNRVQTDGSSLLYRYRMSSIYSETGGSISVGYSLRECSKTNLPAAPSGNGLRCFPAFWTKPGATGPTAEYFHKYLVTSVVMTDHLGGNPPDTTTYTYLGAPGWHYDESEFTPPSRKTWGQWRGYEKVRVVHGQAGSVQTITDHQYFRGMDEDKQPSGVRDVKITDSDGVQLDDSPWRAGQQRETRAFTDAVAGVVASTKKIDPWQHGPTATRNRNGVVAKAYLVNAVQVTEKAALDGGRGWRTTRTVNSFDITGPTATGLITQVDNQGNDATNVDDQCTRYEYARNDAKWMRSYLTRVSTVSVGCATTPNLATQVLSDVRTLYDGAASYGSTISKGDKTREEQRSDWVGGGPVYAQVSRTLHDSNGRVRESWDALDRHTATAYTPASGSPVTAQSFINPMGWTTSATVEPAWGLATRTVDANNRATDLSYDALGRLTAVWRPGRSKAAGDSANTTFSYAVRNGVGPTAVITSQLNKNGGYVRAATLYDGNLNQRQTQSTAPDGGVIITDTIRDSRGSVVRKSEPYYTNLGVGTTLFVPQYAPPGDTQTLYDPLERPTTAIFRKNGAEQWRTRLGYGGDRVDTTPPAGAPPTSTVTDARGNTLELRQYHGSAPTGGYDATRYAYTGRGQLAAMTDAAGNTWRYTYDQRGRKVRAEDPDTGVSTYTYDHAGQLLTSTDGRGQTLVREHDPLGRTVRLRDGSPSGPTLADWAWDTVLKGQLGSATRYSGGNAYTSRVTAWDAAYRPLTAQMSIPAAETGLAGTYEWRSTYNIDGTVATQTLPEAGGLSAETLTFGYSDVGLATTLGGQTPYITATGYTGIGQVSSISANTGAKELGQYWFWEEGTGRLAEQLAFDATVGNVYQDLYYGYDPAGNLTSIADNVTQYGSPGPDDTQCFRYDRLRRLTDAWTPNGGSACASNPTVAGLAGPSPYWHSYTYDVTGNRRTEIQHTSSGDISRTYTYPAVAAVQPHAVRSVTTTGPGINRTDTYGYDPAGNTTTRPGPTAGQTLTWNSEGHVAAVTESGQTTSFLYDADGNRLIRRDGTGTTLYLPGMELFKPAGAAPAACTRFYSHAGQPIAVRTAAGLRWQVADHHGTSILSLDAATLAKTQRRTLPFGGIRGANPTWPSQRGFVGGTIDTAAGTVHLGAREYDTSIGRFISADPVIDPADPQQINAYSYATNNPLTLSDPDGLRPQCPDDDCHGSFNRSDPAGDPARSPTGGTPNPGAGHGKAPCRDGGKGTSSCDTGSSKQRPNVWDQRAYKNGTVLIIYDDSTIEINGYVLPIGNPDPYLLAESVDRLAPKMRASQGGRSDIENVIRGILAGCETMTASCTSRDGNFRNRLNADLYAAHIGVLLPSYIGEESAYIGPPTGEVDADDLNLLADEKRATGLDKRDIQRRLHQRGIKTLYGYQKPATFNAPGGCIDEVLEQVHIGAITSLWGVVRRTARAAVLGSGAGIAVTCAYGAGKQAMGRN